MIELLTLVLSKGRQVLVVNDSWYCGTVGTVI